MHDSKFGNSLVIQIPSESPHDQDFSVVVPEVWIVPSESR